MYREAALAESILLNSDDAHLPGDRELFNANNYVLRDSFGYAVPLYFPRSAVIVIDLVSG